MTKQDGHVGTPSVSFSVFHASIFPVPGTVLNVHMEMLMFYLAASVTPASTALLNVHPQMGTQANSDSKPSGQSLPYTSITTQRSSCREVSLKVSFFVCFNYNSLPNLILVITLKNLKII